MFISGFTFAKNAVRYDYPLQEAIRSILPLCDEVVVAIGDSDDGTVELVEALNDPKIRIIRTVWDESLREGGKVLADETNKAFDAISPLADWAVYVQADECFHEQDYEHLRKVMASCVEDREVDGILVNYRHFYGSYDYLGDSPRWYRREIRIIRNDKSIRSYKDAQGFRKNGQKLKVAHSQAYVHHYGWVKHPKLQRVKNQEYQRYWHDDQWMEQNRLSGEEFDYSEIDSLKRFNGSHPQAMQSRIDRVNWKFSHDVSRKSMNLKNRLKYFLLKNFGWYPGEYRNYEIIRRF